MTNANPLSLSVSDLVVKGEGQRALLTIPALDVPAGCAVAVRGPSGAGKSTLIYALAGLLKPAQGCIRWGETDIAGLPNGQSAAFRRDNIGFVFQEHLLFEELSPERNATIAALYANRRARKDIWSRGIDRLARFGLDTTGKRRSDTFSGGERQRIAVARALATDPQILLADEPTASLDRPNADRLANDLIALAQQEGRMLIAVTHDPALHASVDRIIDVADGRIVDDAAEPHTGVVSA